MKLKRTILLGVLALALFARVVRIFIQTGAPSHPARAGEYLSGEIVQIEAKSGELVLESFEPGQKYTTRVRAEPRITWVHTGSKALELDELRVGDHATVRFSSDAPDTAEARFAKEVRVAR